MQTYSMNRSASSPKIQDGSPRTSSVGLILHDSFSWHNNFTLSFTPFVPQFCDIQLLSQVALWPWPWPKKDFVIAILVPGAQDKETFFWSSQPCTLTFFGAGSLIGFTMVNASSLHEKRKHNRQLHAYHILRALDWI